MKRAQQTIQKDAVIFTGIRLEYLYIYEEKPVLVVVDIIPPGCTDSVSVSMRPLLDVSQGP